MDYSPSTVVLQALSNDIKNSELSEDDIERKTKEVVDIILGKWPQCKVVISLPPPRKDSERLCIKSELVCAKLKTFFYGRTSVLVTEHTNFDPFSDEYENDRLHISKVGTKHLATNIRRAVIKVLGLKGGRGTRLESDGEGSDDTRPTQPYGRSPHGYRHRSSPWGRRRNYGSKYQQNTPGGRHNFRQQPYRHRQWGMGEASSP